jgi:uncharacterized membrane protein
MTSDMSQRKVGDKVRNLQFCKEQFLCENLVSVQNLQICKEEQILFENFVFVCFCVIGFVLFLLLFLFCLGLQLKNPRQRRRSSLVGVIVVSPPCCLNGSNISELRGEEFKSVSTFFILLDFWVVVLNDGLKAATNENSGGVLLQQLLRDSF